MVEEDHQKEKGMIASWFDQFKNWLKPVPEDSNGITFLKSIYKAIAVLVLIAFSPVILIILLVTFFAAF
jgi:hypothetical protein